MSGKRQPGSKGPGSKGASERSADETAPKRRRVSRACDQCRAAREKCDGIQPTCFPCASQNRTCSWEEPKKKRGVQTGYIRTLEMALGWIFDKIPESEKSLHSLLTHEGGQGLLTGKVPVVGNRLHRRWRRSTVHAEIDRVLSGDCASAASTNCSSPGGESEGDETDKDLAAQRDSIFVTNITKSPASFKVEIVSPNLTQSKDQQSHDSTVSKGINTACPLPESEPSRPRRPNTICLPSNHWRLLDIYFSYTHVWFPILEKHELLKTGYSYSDEGLHIGRHTPGCAGHAELWAALALASYQEMASRAGKCPEKGFANPACMKPRDIYRTARNMIPTSESGLFEARHVNALLLLTLVNMACNELKAAWILLGMATRVALSLRLQGSSMSAQDRRSCHTYMGCFILDTLLSARLGLVPHLRSSMARASFPRLDNEIDEWQPWMPCASFGPTQRDMRPSRMPSHSISSFGILHGCLLLLSHRLWDDAEISILSDEAFLSAVQRAISERGVQASLATSILSGEHMAGQLPSVHLLRLTFLYAGSMCKGLPHLHRAVLSCIESYIGNHGVCGLSPLTSVFMKLIDQRVHTNLLSRAERKRWEEIEQLIESVWNESAQDVVLESIYQDTHPGLAAQHSTSDPELTLNTRAEQSPEANSFQLSTIAAHSTTNTNTGLPFSQDLNVKLPELPPLQPNQGIKTRQMNGPPLGIGGLGTLDTLAIPPAMQFSAPESLSFNGVALDYDTILDDIASFERTSVPESDTQFMANLGLRPGTNLTDVFSHEFLGYP
ncbi:fungal-specific transcription factor domain-containing protein [Astrocystis sublimbata]|nr:fungal-specific transcription factor domain-containing protein [Astrocystis sublimbata]